MSTKLYQYQQQGLAEIQRAIKKHNRLLVGWYTGSGKTNMFLKLAHLLAAKGFTVGISSYLQTTIRDQIAARAKSMGIAHEVVKDGQVSDAAITIFNPQALYRLPANKRLDYLLIDESHEGTSADTKMLNAIIQSHCKTEVKIVGFSATPWDLVTQPMWAGARLLVRGLDQGIVDERVQPFILQLEHFEMSVKNHDYNKHGDLKEKFQKRHAQALRRLTKTKMELLLKKHNKELGKKTLVICPKGDNCALAKYVHSLYPDTSLILTGDDHDEKAILNRFKHDKNIRFLMVVSKCRVGFDMPELTSVVDMSLTRNIKALVQTFGRLTRLHPAQDSKRYFYISNQGMSREKIRTLFTLAFRFACGNYTRPERETQVLNVAVPQPRQREERGIWDVREFLACLANPKLSTYHMVKFTDNRATDAEMLELALAFGTPKWKTARTQFIESCQARGIALT